MKKAVLIATVLTASICAMAAWSQGGPGRMGGHMINCPAMAIQPPPMLDHLAKTLGLSRDQTARLKKAAQESENSVRASRQEAEKASQALRQSVLSASYSPKKTKELAAKAEKAEARVINSYVDSWTRIRSVLTKTQAAKLVKAYGNAGPRPFGPPPGGFPPPPGPRQGN